MGEVRSRDQPVFHVERSRGRHARGGRFVPDTGNAGQCRQCFGNGHESSAAHTAESGRRFPVMGHGDQ